MKNDKITTCFTDPNTGREIKTGCTNRSLISLSQINKEISDLDISSFRCYNLITVDAYVYE